MQNLELNISGMTCDACVSHVSKALQSVPGVQNARVDLAGSKAQITGENLDQSALIAAVEEDGYGAAPVENAA